jgi:hypothetical protein
MQSSPPQHHLDHHKLAIRNYGVTTKLCDRIFGAMSDDEKGVPVERGAQHRTLRSASDADSIRIAPSKWIWTHRAIFGNKATKFGTSFGRKCSATTGLIWRSR